jgi:hypothetical protein
VGAARRAVRISRVARGQLAEFVSTLSERRRRVCDRGAPDW